MSTTREMDSGLETALAAQGLLPVFLFKGEFLNGTVRLWNGMRTLQWDGADWLGAGTLLNISGIGETRELRARGIQVTLSGINTDIFALVFNNVQAASRGTVYLGVMDVDTNQLDSAVELFSGYADVPTINDYGSTCIVNITYESELIDLQQPPVVRITDAYQKSRYPSDRGFEYVASIQDRVVEWGGGAYDD